MSIITARLAVQGIESARQLTPIWMQFTDRYRSLAKLSDLD